MHEARSFEEIPTSVGMALDYFAAAARPTLPTRTDRPLYLYGAGNLGRMAQEFCRAVEVPVAGTFEHDQAAPLDSRVAVCVVTSPYLPIREDLNRRGHDNVVPFYDLAETLRGDRHPLANGWLAEPLTYLDREKIKHVWKRWDDDASRAHHLQFLAWRCLREEWCFEGAPVRKGDIYFIPEVREVLHDHEVFLDGGAHRGETTVRFASFAGRGCSSIMVEADKTNVYGLEFPVFGTESVKVLNQALTSTSGYVKFCGGFGLASKLAPSGNTFVRAVTVDSLDVSLTFVKLHLEGGELDALRGAASTLQRCRPILCVAVDHDSDGLWRTADWMMSYLDDYRFLFRNHCWCASCAVVYAIPRERGL